jgi:Xaa-Pro aminopeptidase
MIKHSKQLESILRVDVSARDIDNAARVHISNQGFGDNFIHTTGHGLGLDIHENPSINWQNTDLIKNNIVFTIEPGIYLEGEFGFRYENTVLTTNKGIEVLTKS